MLKRLLAVPAAAVVLIAACGTDNGEGAGEETRSITLYSGRSESLVGPLVARFQNETGVRVDARYGDSAELAATILEEGPNSPADVYWAQDAGALGALSEAGRLTQLPSRLLDRVLLQFQSGRGEWVGTSGRARVLAYNTDQVSEDELPASVLELTGEEWSGRVGWAPTNGSFQAFVTALRLTHSDDTALQWLEGMRDNEAQVYENNSAIVRAVADGEVDTGLVNHYYRHQLGSEDATIAASAHNHFFSGGDAGSVVNIARPRVLDSTGNRTGAEQFIEFLLSQEAQGIFANDIFEYPLVSEVGADTELPPLESLEQPDLDLSDLSDLEGTLALLRQAGVL
jgi:iron(III) transport system substrate-binding protein